MKKRIVFASILLLLSLLAFTSAAANGPIVHRVSAGGPDICVGLGEGPGCDGNFSLTAREYSDGTVSGQWSDSFGRFGHLHAVIDCLVVDGNDAWVSGVVTHGVFHDLETGEDIDFTGLPVATRLRDNGTSANDPADQISFSWVGDPTPCTEKLDYDLFDAPQGQVRVD